MNEFKNVATIDFRVVGGTLEDAYDMMTEYQLLGQAGDDSNIIYNGISIPAGYSESLEEVEALYQVLKKETDGVGVQRRTHSPKIEIDFYTEEDNLEEVFECMQQYKDHGYADKHANIVYHDVVIPAGYCDSVSEVAELYNAMVTGDLYGYFEVLFARIIPMEFYDQYYVERAKLDRREVCPPLISDQNTKVYTK